MSAIKTITGGNTHPDGVLIGASATEKIGFCGAAPAVQPSGAGQAVPTDLSSAIVFCTKIRTDLIALGLIKGSA